MLELNEIQVWFVEVSYAKLVLTLVVADFFGQLLHASMAIMQRIECPRQENGTGFPDVPGFVLKKSLDVIRCD